MKTSYLPLIRKRRIGLKKFREQALLEAGRLASLLNSSFQFEALFLHGSVLSDSFRPSSDMDLVIKGLETRKFFSAYSLLLRESRFPVDLKPFEDLSEAFQTNILRVGVQIG
jgi:predicted nucleotidyltransferase